MMDKQSCCVQGSVKSVFSQRVLREKTVVYQRKERIQCQLHGTVHVFKVSTVEL